MAKDGVTSPYVGVTGLGFGRCNQAWHDLWSSLGWTPQAMPTWIASSTRYTGLDINTSWVPWHDGHPLMWTQQQGGKFSTTAGLPKYKVECQGKCWSFVVREIVAAMSSRIFSKNMCWTKKHIKKKGQPQTLKATNPVWGSQVGYVYHCLPVFTPFHSCSFFGVGHCWSPKKCPHLLLNSVFLNWKSHGGRVVSLLVAGIGDERLSDQAL